MKDNFDTVAKDDVWFTMYIKVEGKHVITKVDDKVIVDYTEEENQPRRESPAAPDHARDLRAARARSEERNPFQEHSGPRAALKVRRLHSSMFHLTVLGSGSAGNCALIESPALPAPDRWRAERAADGAAPAAVRGEPAGDRWDPITHEHSDHATGLAVWFKQFATPIYCNRLTAEALCAQTPELSVAWRLFVTGSDFTIGDLTVQTFPVPHDAVDPVGFVFHHGWVALGVLTDLGCATKLAYERVRQVSTLLIETNHDEKLLQNDMRRPWSVKQRIMSRHGHLSNAAAAEVLAELLGYQLRQAVLGHLSRDCNSPELALGAIRARLDSAGARDAGSLLRHPARNQPALPGRRRAIRRPRRGQPCTRVALRARAAALADLS